MFQALPSSASAYAQDQRAEIKAAVLAVRRQWRRMGPEFDLSYRAVEPSLLAIVRTAQERVAAGAQTYIPAVLAETGQTAAVDPFARASTTPLVGVAGDGRRVEGLLYGAVTRAKTNVTNHPVLNEFDVVTGWEPAMTRAQALASSGHWLSMTVGTLLSDTGRQSESLAMGVRPVSGYIRMLSPPSCSRCVVLAGKWYRKNTGFARHFLCDCRHIPASESMAGDLTVDPVNYFDSLSATEQDRVFTKSGAEALRADANMSQVVNARRGMKSAQVGGRKVLITTEGTTRRGVAYQSLSLSKASDVKVAGRRYARASRPRLMPETIQRVATDRADYLRLLNANGYLG